ncbi:MAG: sigma-70 family RNA polymerase sigma factor [Bacteroidota bacterium]
MEDQKIIEGITSNNHKSRNEAVSYLYEEYLGTVKKYVLANSGNMQDVEDIFQDGLVSLYANLVAKRFQQKSSLGTYFISICKNLWLMHIRKTKSNALSSEGLISTHDEVVSFIKTELIHEIMKELKEDCYVILHDFYFKRKNLSEIQRIRSISSKQVLKNKKGRCLRYLSRILEKRKIRLENLFETNEKGGA